jgi:hypothetical protein
VNTALACLVAAYCSLTPNDVPDPGLQGNSLYSAALSDVSGDGKIDDWMTPGLWNRPPSRSSTVIRGQSPQVPDASAYDSAPQTQSSAEAQTFVQGADPNAGGITGPTLGVPSYDPFLGGGNGGFDPLAQQQMAPSGLEYYDPFSRDFQYGLMGPQPYRLGGLSNYEAGYIGQQSTKGVPGNFSVMEVNAQWRYSSYLPSGTIFSWKPEFNYRGWSGPDGVPLPGHAYRFASDIEWAGQGPGPWGFQIGFTPQLATDFDKQISSDAWMFDGRGILFYRADPTLMLVGGVAFWDRVTDRFIPHAGIVWTPDDTWEFRLLFPKSRISVLLGDYGYGAVWFYGSGEYNVEAYQVGLSDLNRKDQVEFSDYRLLLGLRSDNGIVSSFIEGGWVLDRQVDFKYKTTDFDIKDGWLVRAGIRF